MIRPKNSPPLMFYVEVLLCSALVMAALYVYVTPRLEWSIPSLMLGLTIVLGLAFARAKY